MKKSTVNQELSRPPEHCRARKVIGRYDQWYGMIWLCRSIDPPISICSVTFHVRPHFAASPSHLPHTMPSVPSSLLAMMPILPGPGCPRLSQAATHAGCHPGGPVPGSHLQHLPVPATASALEYPAVLGPNSTGTAPSRESQSLRKTSDGNNRVL